MTKKLHIPTTGNIEKQILILQSGGLRLHSVSKPNIKIKDDELSFSIHSPGEEPDKKPHLIIDKVKPGMLVRLNAGTYQVISQYGNYNALVNTNIKVEAGKLVDATILNQAAKITFKLVSEKGGEAIADTAWSILTSSGDIVGESVSAFPSMILAEGEYIAIARNKEKIYQREFLVKADNNIEVEVLLKQQRLNIPTNTSNDTETD